MALRTAGQYLDSLRDDRVVYYAGERIRDVVEHPHFGLRARANAEQLGALSRPVPGGTCAIFLAGEYQSRLPGSQIAHGRIVDRQSLSTWLMDGHSALLA